MERAGGAPVLLRHLVKNPGDRWRGDGERGQRIFPHLGHSRGESCDGRGLRRERG